MPEWSINDLYKNGETGMFFDGETNAQTDYHADGSKTITKDPYGAENKMLREQRDELLAALNLAREALEEVMQYSYQTLPKTHIAYKALAAIDAVMSEGEK